MTRILAALTALVCLSLCTTDDLPRWALTLSAALAGAAVTLLATRPRELDDAAEVFLDTGRDRDRDVTATASHQGGA